MKIIRRSNFDCEDHRGDERLVAAQIASEVEAAIMCAVLNTAEGEFGESCFHVKPDDYVLKPDWQP